MRYLRISVPRDVFGSLAPEIGGEVLNDHRLMIVFPLSIDRDSGFTLKIVGREVDVQNGFDALPEEIRRRSTIDRVDEYSQ